MSKITEALSERIQIDEKIVNQVIDGLQLYVTESLKNGEEVRITDFVVFDFIDKPERTRRNPRTQEPVVVPPQRIPKIRFAGDLKEEIQPDFMTMSVTNQLPPIPAEVKQVTLPPLPPELEEKYYLSDGIAYSKKELKKLEITANTPVYHPDKGGWKKASSYFPKWF